MKVTRTERGWAGHFIGGASCEFHRNTLLTYGKKRFVISTVGRYRDSNGRLATIGVRRYYETMAFHASYDEGYLEADVSKQIQFESPWSIGEIEQLSDLHADEMHERVVDELSKRMTIKTAKKEPKP